ncbi:MAG: DUF2189 domain-containing protein [Acetobacteraceae bacterium]|nr:DUF2189 domain-containing protein [Acetobacteraceae bacterium]
MAIQSPIEWGWEQLKVTASTVGSTSPDEYWSEAGAQPGRLTVRRIGVADLRHALAKGFEDFGANRTDIIFLCIIYPVVGLILARLVFGYEMLHFIFPLASGFALIGPVAAIGLNEMSRRREKGMNSSWAAAFGVFRSPAIGSIMLLSGVLVAIFLLWLAAAYGIYRVTLGPTPPATIASFLHDVFATGPGWALIGIGVCVGFLFAVVVLTISVVSFPLLLDRNVGVETAVRTSIHAVLTNPATMAVWGLIIAGGLIVGSVPFLLGLVIIMPVLGHATWHLYRSVVTH